SEGRPGAAAGMALFHAAEARPGGGAGAAPRRAPRTGRPLRTLLPRHRPARLAEAGLAAYGSNLALRLQPRGTTAALAAIVKHAILRKHARVVYPRSYFFVRWFGPVVRFFLDRFAPALAETTDPVRAS